MRVAIICFRDPVGSRPWLFTSSSKAKAYVAAGTHKRLSKKVIIELSPDATPGPDPSRYLRTSLDIVAIPSLNAPAPVEPNLNLFYPLKDYSSYAKANFERIWGTNCGRIGTPIPYQT